MLRQSSNAVPARAPEHDTTKCGYCQMRAGPLTFVCCIAARPANVTHPYMESLETLKSDPN